MTNNLLNLFCLVDGEGTSNEFSVTIPSTDTVDDLKNLIKDKKIPRFDDDKKKLGSAQRLVSRKCFPRIFQTRRFTSSSSDPRQAKAVFQLLLELSGDCHEHGVAESESTRNPTQSAVHGPPRPIHT
ncbi:hypothetical protein KI688_006478 [Linnemannia hyalina]|uniref:Crinkler effector protein N-terminal domain-containing protein n=1 Tax=Linnemannia hyalina TaxID=64524 RepID=A0A9P7XMC0_9FUNG|nr:hypothetical protein KI688_006478 [Linnemannia hyalina]